MKIKTSVSVDGIKYLLAEDTILDPNRSLISRFLNMVGFRKNSKPETITLKYVIEVRKGIKYPFYELILEPGGLVGFGETTDEALELIEDLLDWTKEEEEYLEWYKENYELMPEKEKRMLNGF